MISHFSSDCLNVLHLSQDCRIKSRLATAPDSQFDKRQTTTTTHENFTNENKVDHDINTGQGDGPNKTLYKDTSYFARQSTEQIKELKKKLNSFGQFFDKKQQQTTSILLWFLTFFFVFPACEGACQM